MDRILNDYGLHIYILSFQRFDRRSAAYEHVSLPAAAGCRHGNPGWGRRTMIGEASSSPACVRLPMTPWGSLHMQCSSDFCCLICTECICMMQRRSRSMIRKKVRGGGRRRRRRDEEEHTGGEDGGVGAGGEEEGEGDEEAADDDGQQPEPLRLEPQGVQPPAAPPRLHGFSYLLLLLLLPLLLMAA